MSIGGAHLQLVVTQRSLREPSGDAERQRGRGALEQPRAHLERHHGRTVVHPDEPKRFTADHHGARERVVAARAALLPGVPLAVEHHLSGSDPGEPGLEPPADAPDRDRWR